ncbi:fibronectin type III domain-containing protein [Flavobacterium sp. PLA-1-15]|uniref:fibronectin type III domain-containing protein n=1 Tax=Flavobacterium sp. PLA-1-15 TaxID=3380533 RepID=UPI003B7D9C2D
MKKITFCVLMVLSVFMGFSQVSIGVGNTIYTGLPFEPVNLYSYTQTIYRASDINASGTISSLKWQFTGVDQLENSQDVTVYLAHTTKNSFASDDDWVSLNDLTLVYTGGLEINESGWVEIPFDQGFAYNGTDNLVVAVKENHPGNDSNYDEFYNSVGPANTSIASWSHFADINPNPANPPYGNRMPYYPNIIFEGITQACPTPFAVHAHAENIGTTTATIDWEAPVNIPSGGSQYFISTSALPPTDDTELSGSIASGNSISLENLIPATAYNIWIRSVCANGVFSPWSTVHTFVTVCTPTNAFFESFDEVATPALPTCWTKIVRGDNLNEFARVETEGYGDTQVIRMTNGNSQDPTDELLLIAPEIGNLTAGTHRLKFSAWDKGGGGALINVQIVTLSDNTPDATYTLYTTIDTESSFTGTDYIVDFTNYDGTDTFVGFKFNAASWGSIVHLDNIRWEPIPPCPDVDATTIEIDELVTTENTASIYWGTDEVESWEVSYGVSTLTNPDAGTIVPAAEPAKELTTLTPNTDYNVWVRTVCEEGNGHWIGPITFRTQCEGVDAINENFDSLEVIPDCWNKLIDGPTLGSPSIYLASIDWISYSTPNTISIGSGYSDTAGADNIIFVSPKISNLGAGTHRFKFRAFSGGPSADDIQVVLLNSNRSTEGMTVVGTFTSTSGMSGDMMEYVVNFDQLEGNTESYIGIRMNSSLPSGTLYLDNIVWEPMPPCADTGIVSISNIEIDSAKLSWTPGGDETMWQVAYGLSTATDPEAATLFTTTAFDEENLVATANLSGLEASTIYKVWVRSMCGEDGNGQWSVPVTFKTDCNPIDAINENFDTTANKMLPECWSKILRGETLANDAVVEVAPVPANLLQTAPHTINIFKSTSGVDDDMIIVSPELTNLSAGTHRLTFFATYLYAQGSLQIGTLNSNNPDAVFTPLEDVAITTTSEYYTVDFANYNGTDTFFGIRLNSSGANTVALIDNLKWEPTPSCATLLNVEVVDITDVGAEVIWTTPGDENSWQVVHALSTVTSPEGLNPATATLNPMASLTGLEDATQYNVWVRSVCGDNYGAWFGPVTFKTDCTAVTAFSQNFDTTATPALPECWKSIKRGNTLSSMAVIETSGIGAFSAPNVIVIYKGTNGVNDDMIIVSPKVSNAAAGTHKLMFSAMMQNGAGASLEIGTLDGYTADAVFTPYENVSPTAAYQQFSIDFSQYSGSDQYIGIRLNSTAFHTVAYMDNIVWQPVAEMICPAVATINENFDTTAVNTLPECWTEIVRGPSAETSLDAVTVKESTAGSAPNAINFFKGLSTPSDEQILVLPQVSNLGAGTHKLSFDAAGPPCQIEVGTLSSNLPGAIFAVKETITITGVLTQHIVDFTDYVGTNSYLGLRLVSGDSPFVSMYVDNVVWSSTLSTVGFNTDNFRYYPNPVKDVLNLSYDKNITKVAVYNVLGQEIMIKNIDANQSQLDMSSLASGTYLVKIMAEKAEKTVKVIKQ